MKDRETVQEKLEYEIFSRQCFEQECEELKEKVKELHQGWINCDKERNLQEANSEFRQRVINRYKQTLTEIKEIAEENIRIADLEGLNGVYRRGLAKQILQKIREVEK